MRALAVPLPFYLRPPLRSGLCRTGGRPDDRSVSLENAGYRRLAVIVRPAAG
jgi:hypothetical protein